MHWYLDVLKNKYAQFSGRARRKEYWMFFLINFLICMALAAVDALTGTLDDESGTGLLGALYLLAVVLPTIALNVRRLHDTNRSGWWLLVALSGIGIFVLLVFMCMDGTAGDNQYGASPKHDAPEAHPAGA